MQINMAMSYHLISAVIAIMKKTSDSKCWPGNGREGTVCRVYFFYKTVCRFKKATTI